MNACSSATLNTDLQQARCNTIGAALTRISERYGQKTAISFQDRHWSFSQLDQASNRVARQLLALGLTKGDRVAAYGKNSDAYLILWLACTKAGLIHVPLNFSLVERELTFLLNQSGARALFMDLDLHQHVAAIQVPDSLEIQGTLRDHSNTKPHQVLHWALADTDSSPLDLILDEHDVVQILYTSGTTSDPKGAMHTHSSLLTEYRSCWQHLDIVANDFALAALPLYHSAQMHVFTMPTLLMGGSSWIIDAVSADKLLPLIKAEQLNAFFAPPTVWINLLRHPAFDERQLQQLTKLYYGASIMPAAIVQELSERLPKAGLYNCYGQSEIAPLASVLRPEEHAERPTSAGHPLLSVRTRVINPQTGEPCAANEQGEIVHQSAQLMQGYWDNPEATRKAFRQGWFHSGDLGYQDEQGYLYIVDRINDVVNSGGVLIASRDVEEVLYSHPMVAEVAVIGVPDERWIEAVTAVVVVKSEQQADAAELLRHAKQYLAHFKVPKHIHFVEQLPKNSAGKLLKRELRNHYS